MLLIAALVVALSTAAPVPATSTRDAVRQAVLSQHGSRTQIYSILIKGSYALVQGKGLHEGLEYARGRWRAVCELPEGTAAPATLQQRCGFPTTVATLMSVEEPVNVAASQGQFTVAVTAERQAFASATGPVRDSDRARLQLLTQLQEQMRVQAITREQAIARWSQLQISWSLP